MLTQSVISNLTQPTFVRRPIFTLNDQVFAYELVRHREEPVTASSGDQPIGSDCFYLASLKAERSVSSLTEGRPAMTRLDTNALIRGEYRQLQAAGTILAIEPNTDSSFKLAEACGKARDTGYRLAMDVDTIKMTTKTHTELAAGDIAMVSWPPNMDDHGIWQDLSDRGVDLLATDLETRAEAIDAAQCGFKLRQGAFFRQPEHHCGELSVSQGTSLRLVSALQAETLDRAELSTTIKSDVALTCSLLRRVNAASNGLSHKIDSVPRAITLLGDRTLRRWGHALALESLCENQPRELLITSLLRGTFGECLFESKGHTTLSGPAYLVGMLSLLDTALNMPMSTILEEFEIAPELKAVLLGQCEGEIAKSLAISTACERGAWSTVQLIGEELAVSQRQITETYYSALDAVQQLVESLW